MKERPTGKEIHSPLDVWVKMQEIGNADQEAFWVIGLNSVNREVLRECIFLGGLSRTNFDIRLLFKRLIENGCSSFFLVHNHPSEIAEPSEDDITLTHDVQRVGFFLNINLIDHLIITNDKFCSFKALDKLIEAPKTEKTTCTPKEKSI